MYLGRFVPNVWHNSTTVFLFPFAILLFWKQLKAFDSPPKIKDILLLCFLVILNAAIKPSFLFVYIPVPALWLIKKFKSFRDLLVSSIPILLAIFIILLQYYIIFHLQAGGFFIKTGGVKAGITISKPFQFFTFWIPYWYIPVAFILSYAFPIVSLLIYREITKYEPFLYSLFMTIIGIIIAIFVNETGDRVIHGNFIWQTIISTYLLFLSTITFLAPVFLNNQDKSLKRRIVIMSFLAHVISGVIYIIKVIITQDYR